MDEETKVIKVDKSTHRAAKIEAAKRNISLKQYLKNLVNNDTNKNLETDG